MKKNTYFIFLCSCVFMLGLYGDERLYKQDQIMLGTFVEVTSPDERAAPIVFVEIKRIEDLLSKYKRESEISQLNQLGKLRVSSDTLYVMKKAREFWLATGGAFDPTVGPLLDLWGFTSKIYTVPQDEEIKKVLARVGFDKVAINEAESTIELKVPGMEVDLGAIAKGYAVDCAIKKLKEKGVKSCLINAGGQIYCLGDRFGTSWKIGIKDPLSKKAVTDYLELKDLAVATSGDYEQCFIKENKRYVHIFNPKSGYPIDSQICSVTVIAADGLTADALATSVFVLGKVKGEELIKKYPGARLKIIERSN